MNFYSRDIFRFFVHNSAPLGDVLGDLWRKFSYKPPGPFSNLQDPLLNHGKPKVRDHNVEQISKVPTTIKV